MYAQEGPTEAHLGSHEGLRVKRVHTQVWCPNYPQGLEAGGRGARLYYGKVKETNN